MTRDPDLAQLRKGLQAAPAPEADARAAALRRAMDAFDRSQPARPAVPQPDPAQPGTALASLRRPWFSQWSGLLSGLWSAVWRAPSRLAGGTAAMAAVALAVFMTGPQPDPAPTGLPQDSQPAAEPLARLAPEAASPPVAEALQSAPLGAEGIIGSPAETAAADAAQAPASASVEAAAAALTAPAPKAAAVRKSDEAARDDLAAYSSLRRSLRAGALPPKDQVRIGTLVDHVSYDLPAAAAGDGPLHPAIRVIPTPWNPDTHLVQILVQGGTQRLSDGPPLDLVVLMEQLPAPGTDPLAGVRKALHPENRITLLAAADPPRVILPATPARDDRALQKALAQLSTAGAAGAAQRGQALPRAYQMAQDLAGAGGASHVLLVTGGAGDARTDPSEALRLLAADQRAAGIALSVLGLDAGAQDASALQALAQAGGGPAAFVAAPGEVQRMLSGRLTAPSGPLARDVSLDLAWNPARIALARRIGADEPAPLLGQGVQIAAFATGDQLTLMYEITLQDAVAGTGSTARTTADPPPAAASLGTLHLQFADPASGLVRNRSYAIPAEGAGSDDARFAAAMAAFGLLLQGADRVGTWGWDEAIAAAEAARGPDSLGARAEAIQLMRLARTLDPR